MLTNKERKCAKCQTPLTGKLRRAIRCDKCQKEVNTFGTGSHRK